MSIMRLLDFFSIPPSHLTPHAFYSVWSEPVLLVADAAAAERAPTVLNWTINFDEKATNWFCRTSAVVAAAAASEGVWS